MTTDTADPGTIPRAALLIPSAATLLALMNYTAPMTTLPVTAADLNAGATGQIWILSTISLGLSTTLLAVGGLADKFGRRRIFVIGAVLLAISSAACAVAPNTVVFFVGHIVQGGASAALLAAGLGIIAHSYPPGPQRAHATGIWGAMLGAGIALGPIAAAGSADLADWRLWYWFAAAGSIALAVVALRTVPESWALNPRRTDVAGMATMAGGIVALTTAITLGRNGWTQPAVLILFGAAVVLLGAFVTVERRDEPLLDLALFRRPGFVAATLGALVTGVAVIGLMSSLAALLQSSLDVSAFDTALILGIWSGLSFVSALQAKRLVPVLTARNVLAVGLLLCGVGELGLIGFGPDRSLWWLVVGLAIAGVGSGFANASLAGLAVGSVPVDRAGMGSGANNTARYLGASIGIAMVVSIAQSGSHGADIAVLVSAAIALIGGATIAAIRMPR